MYIVHIFLWKIVVIRGIIKNKLTEGDVIFMLKCIQKINKQKTGLFAAGVLFGTAGIKVLSSKDAKKFYTSCTAAVLRAKDCVMKTVTILQENAEDIYADAKQMNDDRAAAEDVVIEDESEEQAGERETTGVE